MKIRTDFVTNSSSSSFILGRPNENTVTVKDGHKYLKKVQKDLGLDQAISCEHFIDLRYDETKQYDPEDVGFVAEVIMWYSWEEESDKLKAEGKDGLDAVGVESLVTDEGEYFELDVYAPTFTKPQIKAIFDYAYQHYGEVLLGNKEIGFFPFDGFYNGILLNDEIKYKCNHMG